MIGQRIGEGGVDGVVGAGELGGTAVITITRGAAGKQEDRESDGGRTAGPATCDQRLAAEQCRFLELSGHEAEEAEIPRGIDQVESRSDLTGQRYDLLEVLTGRLELSVSHLRPSEGL